jgi:hypothetical protein
VSKEDYPAALRAYQAAVDQRKVLKEGESRRSCKERGSKANLLAFDRAGGGGSQHKKCRKDMKNGGATREHIRCLLLRCVV